MARQMRLFPKLVPTPFTAKCFDSKMDRVYVGLLKRLRACRSELAMRTFVFEGFLFMLVLYVAVKVTEMKMN